MRYPVLIWIALVMFTGVQVSAQNQTDSTLLKELDEIVVTATRSERKLGNVAVPTLIISQKRIQQSGSLRLKDILQEQTGLFITSGFGAGIQMQGLNPDYTLIMIDGEPLVGRTSGVLDLNRITVGNIKKVEIVKGPSSGLYGSEALAGVINIITDKSYTDKLDIGLRYGTYKTLDVNINGSTRVGKLGVNAFINNYHTNGYSIRPSSVDRAILPIRRLTNQVQFNYPITERTVASLSVRYNHEYIKNEFAVANNGQIIYSKGKEINKDWNINPTVTHQFNSNVKTALRAYGTMFEGLQQLSVSNGDAYNDIQKHQFYRIENQTDYKITGRLALVAGGGIIKEYLNSTRYDNEKNRKENRIAYGFIQTEWNPFKPLNIITGLRYDANKLYASALSPKIAAQFSFSEKLRFNASYGKGFKAPDFRQLYLNFTNTAAGGYSVYGTIDAYRLISELDRLGQIEQLEDDYYGLKGLKPELSNGLNAGFKWLPFSTLSLSFNFFRNDISNLIDTRLVALRKVGAGQTTQIFSYLNVKNAYTQGFETEVNYRINKCLSLLIGYQLLLTADKDQLKEIKAGKIYTRDAGGFSRIMERDEYFGLPNKSKHMINMRLQYEADKWFSNIRAIYRSKWAVTDKDGNGIYNNQDEFASGYWMLNTSAGKTISGHVRLQVGIDNLLNYTDVSNLPNMPGRVFYGSFNYSFLKNKKVSSKIKST